MTLKGHEGEVLGAAFHPDGKRVATVSWDRTLRIWNLETGNQLESRRIPASAVAVSYSPSGHRLAATSDSWLAVFDDGKAPPRFVIEPERRTGALGFSHDGKLLASGTYGDEIALLDSDSGKVIRRLPVPTPNGSTDALAFHPTQPRLATGSCDGTVRVWDTQTGRLLRTLHSPQRVDRLAYSRDGRRLATAGSALAKGVQLWDAETGEEAALLTELPGPRNVCFDPRGRRLAAYDFHGRVVVWDVATSAVQLDYLEPQPVPFFENEAWSLAFSADGASLAVTFGGSHEEGRLVRIWSVPEEPTR